MTIDFTRLSAGSAVDRATEPRRIFSALPAKDAKYSYPRDVQSEVWEQWHQRRDERDLIIKMNTGGGKTVVGLLILKSCLNEKKGPAVYLTPDTYLADQVRDEAAALGIETTDDPRNGRYQAGKAVLVVTIHKLVNGRSVFGVAGATQPIPIGTLLVDDAHAGVAYLEDQFTLRVPGEHAAYDQLMTLFEEELSRQSPAAVRDIKDKDRNAVVRVPFWAWADRHDRVLQILHPHRDDKDFLFVWPLIKDCLRICDAAVSAKEIEIAPPCPPIDQIPSLASAARRIYLTATMADDSILVTHFGADPDTVARPITPKTADDLGDRMILTPLDTHPGIGDSDVRRFLAAQAEQHNVVVIVPSRRQAENWQLHAAAVHDKTTIHAGVEQLRSGHVGLVVLVNKYDGIDLPGDACRILAIDGLPEVYSALDRLEKLALEDTDAMVTRQVQRIEQGMGRGVRSNDDYCVVLLLGSKLTQRLHNASAATRFSPATRAQLDLSSHLADMLHDKPFSELSSVINRCLSRDPDWVAASRDALDSVAYDIGRPVPAVAVAQRRAFDQALIGQFKRASDLLQCAADAVTEPRLKGWIQQQVAAYEHLVDPVKAQAVLTSAVANNRAITRPRTGVGYNRLSGHFDQAKRAAEFLHSRYNTSGKLLVGVNALLDDLVPDPENTRKFEQAWAELGEHLGFRTQRPERDVGNGPDVLWLLGDLKFHVIECKSGGTADAISRSDIEQLSHSMDWFVEQYDDTCVATPVLIHKVAVLRPDAAARQGVRVITFEKLADLRTSVRGFAESIGRDQQYADQGTIGQRLLSFNLTAGQFINKWTIPTRKGR